jgi:hypothetical protein
MINPSQIADAFEQIGFSERIKTESRELMLQAAARDLDEFITAYQDRFHVAPDPFALLEENPYKAKAFFQAYLGPRYSVNARLLIWHLLSGAEILSAEFSYRRKEKMCIKFTTSTPYGHEDDFACESPWDFRLFRYIGLLGYHDQVILDGFHAYKNS